MEEPALEELAAERNALWAELAEREARDREVDDLKARVAYVEGSLSWRVTKPLRAVKETLHNVASAVERRRGD
jgi:hypothetical protein